MRNKDNVWKLSRPKSEPELAEFSERMRSEGGSTLVISCDRSKFDLRHLGLFEHVSSLGLEGTPRGALEEINLIPGLSELRMLRVKVADYQFLKGQERLEFLEIRMGGAKSFSAIGNIERLKSLKLLMLPKLEDVSFLADLKFLQYLRLEECKSVKSVGYFPSLSGCTCLRRVELSTMNGLESIEGVAAAPILEDLMIGTAPKLGVEDLRPFLGHPTLRKVLPGIARVNSQEYRNAKELLGELAVDGFYGTEHEDFELR